MRHRVLLQAWVAADSAVSRAPNVAWPKPIRKGPFGSATIADRDTLAGSRAIPASAM